MTLEDLWEYVIVLYEHEVQTRESLAVVMGEHAALRDALAELDPRFGKILLRHQRRQKQINEAVGYGGSMEMRKTLERLKAGLRLH